MSSDQEKPSPSSQQLMLEAVAQMYNITHKPDDPADQAHARLRPAHKGKYASVTIRNTQGALLGEFDTATKDSTQACFLALAWSCGEALEELRDTDGLTPEMRNALTLLLAKP